MVGPQPKAHPDKILQELLLHDIFDDEGELKNRKNVVWSDVCESLKGVIKPLNLFLMVKQDRHNLLASYRHCKYIDKAVVVDDEEEHLDYCSLDSDSEIDEDSPPVPKKSRPGYRRKIKFNIALTAEQWSQISVIPKIYKDGREGQALQGEYASLLML